MAPTWFIIFFWSILCLTYNFHRTIKPSLFKRKIGEAIKIRLWWEIFSIKKICGRNCNSSLIFRSYFKTTACKINLFIPHICDQRCWRNFFLPCVIFFTAVLFCLFHLESVIFFVTLRESGHLKHCYADLPTIYQGK